MGGPSRLLCALANSRIATNRRTGSQAPEPASDSPPSVDFVIVLRCFQWRFHLFECFNVLLAQLVNGEHFAVAALQALILIGGDQDRALAAVTRDDYRLGERNIFIAPDILLEFCGWDLEHAVA